MTKKPGCIKSAFGCLDMIVLSIIGMVFLMAHLPDLSETPTDETASFRGELFARHIIPSALKSPSSADFIDSTISTHRIGDYVDESEKHLQQWRVEGDVDAQNSFGAMLRSHWVVIEYWSGTQMRPRSVFVDGEAVHFH